MYDFTIMCVTNMYELRIQRERSAPTLTPYPDLLQTSIEARSEIIRFTKSTSREGSSAAYGAVGRRKYCLSAEGEREANRVEH